MLGVTFELEEKVVRHGTDKVVVLISLLIYITHICYRRIHLAL